MNETGVGVSYAGYFVIYHVFIKREYVGEKMELKRLISLRNETQGILERYRDAFKICQIETKDELRCLLAGANKNVIKDSGEIKKEPKENVEEDDGAGLSETLLIAATDETIHLGQEFHVATIAYHNPQIKGQRLSGVEWSVEGFEEVDAAFLKRAYQRYHHIPWTIAETKRCVIKELTLEDIDGLFELYQDKELTKYTEPLFEYEEEREYQRAYINNMYRYFGYGMWLVFHKESGEIIGRAGLEHREYHGQTEVELGYLIAPKYQKKGYATEVCLAIIDFYKEELDFPRLNCLIEEGNTSSMKLAEKLGFSYMETIVEQGRNMLRFVRK